MFARQLRWKIIIALFFVMGMALFLPIERAQAHALPTTYSPSPNAVLAAPPSEIRITFSEPLESIGSHIIVVNPSNQEVDNHDSHIASDGVAMAVSLPLLQAGTYVVAWRTTSAQDGHVAGGSYIFHIARADGTVPPLTGKLPSGNSIGGGGNAAAIFDAPSAIMTIGRWVSLLMLTLILGLIFWQIAILPRFTTDATHLPQLADRFRGVAGTAFEYLLIGTIVEASAEIVRISGSVQGLLSPAILSGILFQSHYGQFIVARLILAAIAIFVLESSTIRSMANGGILQGVLIIYGIALTFVMEYSGHGAAGTAIWGPLIDFIHLLANGIWLGGLFVLAIVMIPFLQRQTADIVNRIAARGFAAFSLPALFSVALIIITGPLNAAQRMTGISQMWTTAYGIVLLLKIVLFVGMAAISFWHAFRLRPMLAEVIHLPLEEYQIIPGYAVLRRISQLFESLAVAIELPSVKQTHHMMVSGGAMATAASMLPQETDQSAGKLTNLHPLSRTIFRLIRIEAAFGVGVLLFASLLGQLAGTLAPAPSSASYGATGGVQTLSAKIDGIAVSLHVDPGTFGANTFTLTVHNPDGTPVKNGAIFLLTTMVEMDMGQNEIDLHATDQPGVYVGQGDLPMAGHWKIETVIRTDEDPTHLHRVTLTVNTSY